MAEEVKKSSVAQRRVIIYAVIFSILVILVTISAVIIIGAFYTRCDGSISLNSQHGNNISSANTESPRNSTSIPDISPYIYRLSPSIQPIEYNIKIIPFLWAGAGNYTFKGRVSILLKTLENTDKIVLHASELNIDVPPFVTCEENNSTIRIIDAADYQNVSEIFQFELADDLIAGNKYRININYAGKINDTLKGLYRSSYTSNNTTRWMIGTQFQATHARQVFPCFDEPSFKAEFVIHIARPSNMTSLSNMQIEKKGIIEPNLPNNYVMDVYAKSLPMSTYLVAFAVTDYVRISQGRIHVWAKQDDIDLAEYALSIAPKILEFYEKYFGISFPMSKMDMIALQDLAPGAMENWGLITFRETAMLFEEGLSTIYHKASTISITAHELAHQWFGNLVTPEWWSDLWLNEGFATYVEYSGADSVEPSLRWMDMFVAFEMQIALSADSRKTTHALSPNVTRSNDIRALFDDISYSKGAAIIRMVEHFLTKDVFKSGVKNYLLRNSYKCVTSNDLWNALSSEAYKRNALSSNLSLYEIMDTWTKQAGYPLISVRRNYEADSAIITQARFEMYHNTTETLNQSSWFVPLSYTSANKMDFKSTKPVAWLRKQPKMTLYRLNASQNDWVIFNVQQTGFYRVNYDEKNWKLIINTLHDPDKFRNIDVKNRAQLIDDAMTMAETGLLSYEIALNLTLYLKHEVDFVPWVVAFNNFQHISDLLSFTPHYDKFKMYVIYLLNNVYETVGFNVKSEDDLLSSYRHADVIRASCSMGLEECVINAATLFHYWKNNPQPDVNNPIPANIRMSVYCTAIRIGGKREWDFAWQRYMSATRQIEKQNLLDALACTRDTYLLNKYVDWLFNETSKLKKDDLDIVVNAIMRNPIGRQLIRRIFHTDWQRINNYLTKTDTFISVIGLMLKRTNTQYDLNEVMNLIRRNEESRDEYKVVPKSMLQKANENIRWMENHYGNVVAWLENTLSSITPITNLM